MVFPSLLLLVPFWACLVEERVLPGVPEEALLQAQASPGQADETPQVYERSAAVQVDVRFLGGRPLAETRDIVAQQLGPLIETQPLPEGDGDEMRFQGGTLRVLDGRTYMLRVRFDPPLRRTDALIATGFPPQADRYVVLHREYRLNNAWGFRRIRMRRDSPDNELVTELEAWTDVPGEIAPRP